jgi:hypothetical protein
MSFRLNKAEQSMVGQVCVLLVDLLLRKWRKERENKRILRPGWFCHGEVTLTESLWIGFLWL